MVGSESRSKMVALAFSLFLVQAKIRRSIIEGKKKKKRDRDRRCSIRKRCRSKSPVFADYPLGRVTSWEIYRRGCDSCLEPLKGAIGGLVTHVNADKNVHLRYLAELALKLYNDKKLRSFKLVKVCKINCGGTGFYWLTFRAQEDGGEECPVFRGVVRAVGGRRDALFCEIKEGDEITLLPGDDDYVGS